MCLSLKHGRAVLPLSPGDIPPFPSPLPSHHHPAKFLQEQALLVALAALTGLLLFVLSPVLIVTINPRGLGRAVINANCISLLQGVSCPSIKGRTERLQEVSC